MNLTSKIIRGAPARKTRAHSEKGVLGLNSPIDFLDAGRSFCGHIARITTGRLPVLPWLTYAAIRFLARHVASNARVFEFGGGMSTLWYERHCSEVQTVEDNSVWYSELKKRARLARVSYLPDENSYIASIHAFPDKYFDLIVVDGNIDREQCFRAAEQHLLPRGFIVLDDSDKEYASGGPIYRLDRWLDSTPSYEVWRFTGWVPGCFWVKETTIVQPNMRQQAHPYL